MKPENVGYITELDNDFAHALKQVVGASTFKTFLNEWEYWLDGETKKLEPEDWDWLKPLIDDCRKENIIPMEDRHEPAIALMMPRKLIEVSIIAKQFRVPWGCAYLRMKGEKIINY